MRNSIRLMLAALLICGVTYAAAGAPAPKTISADAPLAQPASLALLRH